MTYMEDIITVFNGNSQIVEHISKASQDVREYISNEFSMLVADKGFKVNCISGHLSNEDKMRVELVFERISSVIIK